MSWEEREVPATVGGVPVTAQVRAEVAPTCRLEVIAADIHARGDGPDLFEALVSVRRQLDAQAVKLWCNGARRDVYPSPMLRQASHGRHAYVLSLPRTAARPPTVDILDVAPQGSTLATVDEQRSWFDRWREDGTTRAEAPR